MEIENTKYIADVMERQACSKHGVPKGIPCYHLYRSVGDILVGVCNKRARAAGFVGNIDPKSLNRSKR
jgi:hypothetical protein